MTRPDSPAGRPHAGEARLPWPWLLLPLLAGAFTRDLWAPDEPRYAQVARELVERGDLLVMHLCGAVYPDKPPLLFWLAGLLGRLSGWSEGAMRLVSLAAMAGTAWLVGRLARRSWGRCEAWLAPAIFLGTVLVTELGGRLQIDPLLCFLVTAALVAITASARGPREAARNWLAAGLCVGLGVLAKGPVAFVAVGLPLLAWRLLGVWRRPASLPPAAMVGGILLSLLLPLAWATAAFLREPALVDQLLFEQHLGKALDGTRHAAPPWKYLLTQPALLLPWTVPVLLGLGAAWRSLRARRRGESADEGLLRAAAWLVSLLVFFSLLVSKRDLYLLPAYPAAALLAARVVAEAEPGARVARLAGGAAAALVALVALLLLLAFGLAPWLEELGLHAADAWRPLVAGAAWLAGLVLVARAARSGNALRWSRALLGTWALAGALTLLLLLPILDRSKSGRELALRIAARPERPLAIPTVGVQPEAYRFYGGVPTVRDDDLALALARDGEQMLALVRRRAWERDLAADLRARLCILDTERVGSREVLLVGQAPAAAVVTR